MSRETLTDLVDFFAEEEERLLAAARLEIAQEQRARSDYEGDEDDADDPDDEDDADDTDDEDELDCLDDEIEEEL